MMNKYEFYSKLLQEDFPVKYRQDFAEHDSEQCKKIQDLKDQLKQIESERDNAVQGAIKWSQRADSAQAQLAEAVGLLGEVMQKDGEGWGTLDSRIEAFLAHNAPAEQQE